jgi:hypothetical protein
MVLELVKRNIDFLHMVSELVRRNIDFFHMVLALLVARSKAHMYLFAGSKDRCSREEWNLHQQFFSHHTIIWSGSQIFYFFSEVEAYIK